MYFYSMSEKLKNIIGIIIIIYLVTGGALYFFQYKLIFRPGPLPTGYQFAFNRPFKEFNIPINEKDTVNAVLFQTRHDSAAKGMVIYFHGNQENINHYAKYASNFTRNGYEVLMMDYRGYGKSRGVNTERSLYSDALSLYELARNYFPPDNIVVYGKSLGTAIAAELASVRDCRYLVLETPYYSFTSLVRRYVPVYPVDWMLNYPFPTYRFLQKVTAPVIIFHGTKDGVIPYRNAARLKPYLKSGDEFITISGGSHNDLNDYPLFHQKLDSLLQH